MRNFDQIIGSLPAARRAKIAARTRELIAEEMALRSLRKAHDLTQQSMAKLLKIDQAGVSKIESRSDMLISTLRSYIEAMDGSLRLVAEFPDGAVELSSLGEALDTGAKIKAKDRSTGVVKAKARRKPRLVHAD
ncbi:MAG TPA: helix-turn-helix transcriptional regulator [Xanthobacteraceae bacterium]|nr:helix-turn-helix transcriptional regulator [Xanthobacteraceae bacterium]